MKRIFVFCFLCALSTASYATGLESGLLGFIEKILKSQGDLLSATEQGIKSLHGYQTSDLSDLLNDVNRTLSQGEGLSYSSLNFTDDFDQIYGDVFDPGAGVALDERNRRQQETTLDTLKNTLEVAGDLSRSVKDEQRQMKRLGDQAKSATGQLEVMQVGTEMSLETVNELQRLETLVGAQVDAQNAYMAHEVAEEAQEDAIIKMIAETTMIQEVRLFDPLAFGVIPPM